MSKSLDIRLLDTVAEDVKKKRIARVGACRIEDLRWINGRLCVEHTACAFPGCVPRVKQARRAEAY